MKGKIIRGIGGFYYVHTLSAQAQSDRAGVMHDGGCIYECKAKGIFRKDNIKPLPGDFVEITVLDEEKKLGNIDRIWPRKNVLIRPAVANVDQAMVIFALASPKPNFNLLDRFLVMMEKQEIPCVLIFNKKDLVEEAALSKVRERYLGSGYELHFISAQEAEGVEEVRRLLKGKTTTVAGPSGVGKSSLVNQLQDGICMETGAVSAKIERGRHTTRHTELMFVEEDTYILDTPGFSSVDLMGVEKETLDLYFPEMKERRDDCRFAGCAHLTEPDCAVRRAVSEGEISGSRYENYRLFYEECKARRKY